LYEEKRGKKMIKHIYILIVFALLPVSASFGADFSLSAGGGGFLGGLFTRYTLSADGEIGKPADILSTQKIDQLNYGAYLFIDATWVEFSFGFQGGNSVFDEEYSATADGAVLQEDRTKGTGREAMLGFTLLGKYPFRLNDQFTLFPLAGVEYQIALLEFRQREKKDEYDRAGGIQYDRTDGIQEYDSNGDAYKLSAWNSFLIDVGAGLDFAFYPGLFLRAELLYGFRLMTPYEVDALEKLKKQANAPDPKLAGLTSGPALKIGVGYRFR
jgi:opacity protein-like surface antigen